MDNNSNKLFLQAWQDTSSEAKGPVIYIEPIYKDPEEFGWFLGNLLSIIVKEYIKLGMAEEDIRQKVFDGFKNHTNSRLNPSEQVLVKDTNEVN